MYIVGSAKINVLSAHWSVGMWLNAQPLKKVPSQNATRRISIISSCSIASCSWFFDWMSFTNLYADVPDTNEQQQQLSMWRHYSFQLVWSCWLQCDLCQGWFRVAQLGDASIITCLWFDKYQVFFFIILKLCCLIYPGLSCIMQQYCNVDIATVVNDINKRLLTPLSDVTSSRSGRVLCG